MAVSAPEELLGARADTPRSAYEVLPRRVTVAVVAWLLGLAVVAWVITVRQADSMSEMVSGLGQVGGRMPNDMTIPIFAGMWNHLWHRRHLLAGNQSHGP